MKHELLGRRSQQDVLKRNPSHRYLNDARTAIADFKDVLDERTKEQESGK